MCLVFCGCHLRIICELSRCSVFVTLLYVLIFTFSKQTMVYRVKQLYIPSMRARGARGDTLNFSYTVLSFLICTLTTSLAFSGGGAYSGPSFTTGPTSSHFHLNGAVLNPAMPSLLVDQDERWRWSYFPNTSASIEFGNIDDFVDEIDDLIDFVNESNIVNQDVTENINRFNQIIGELSDDGYIKADLSIHAPLLPLVHTNEFFDGAMSIDLTYRVQAAVRLFDSPIEIDLPALEITTAASLYVKSGIETKLSFSYSQDISRESKWFSEKQTLYAGVKLNLISLDLSRQIIPLMSLGGQNIDNVIVDEYNNSLQNNVDLAFDIGFVFDSEAYRLGLTVENLNSPEFEFGTVGQNCNEEPLGLLRDNCLAGQVFTAQGRIDETEDFTLEPRVRTDALYKLHKNLHISTAIDLNEYQDVTGFSNQWFYVSSLYNTPYYLLPSVRFGYQKNLADEGTSSLILGASIFKFLNIDLEYGLESVTVRADEFPRRLGLSISVEEHF